MNANKGSSFSFFSSLYAFYSCLLMLLFKIVFLPTSKQITNSLFHIPNPGIIQNQKSKLHRTWLPLHNRVAELGSSHPCRRSTCPPTPLTTHSLACPCNLRPEQSSLGGWQRARSIPVPEPQGDFPVLQMSWRSQKSSRARNDRHKEHLHGNHLSQHSGSKRKGGGFRERQLREMVPEDQVGAPSPGPGKSSEKGKSQPQIV